MKKRQLFLSQASLCVLFLLCVVELFIPKIFAAMASDQSDAHKYKTIHVVPLDVTLRIGEQWTFSAIGISENNEEHDITPFVKWEISQESTEIGKAGTVVAEHLGEYWITASLDGLKSGKAKLVIIKPKVTGDKMFARGELPEANVVTVAGKQGQSLMKNTPAVTISPKIKSIGGYGDGLGVSDGKWTGQGSSCNSKGKGKYYGYYAVESVNKSFWTINGTGFGDKKGKIDISDKDISVSIDSWRDKAIKIYVKTNHNYASKTGITVTVTTFDNKSDKTPISILGVIKTRGYGQCTWYVANNRLDQGKIIPSTAYSSSLIDWKYRPERWDCLNYKGKHVGIITSPVTKKEGKDQITYSFKVGEMNAMCDEKASPYNGEFIVDTKKKSITKHIGSNAGKSYEATGFYR